MGRLLRRSIINTDVCHSKPTISGLRYPVKMILDLLGFGMSHEEILEDYENILAVLQYVSKLSQVKSVYKVDAA